MIKFVFLKNLTNLGSIKLVENIEEVKENYVDEKVSYIYFTNEIYTEIKHYFEPTHSESLIVFGNTISNDMDTDIENVLYYQNNPLICPYDSNFVYVNSNFNVESLLSENGFLVVEGEIKENNLQALVRPYFNIPLAIKGEEVFYSQLPYLVEKIHLTEKGIKHFNAQFDVGNDLITMFLDIPVNVDNLIEMYQNGYLLYNQRKLNKKKYFKDKRISKGDLTDFSKQLHTFVLTDEVI